MAKLIGKGSGHTRAKPKDAKKSKTPSNAGPVPDHRERFEQLLDDVAPPVPKKKSKDK